jgi:hypothetical protein
MILSCNKWVISIVSLYRKIPTPLLSLKGIDDVFFGCSTLTTHFPGVILIILSTFHVILSCNEWVIFIVLERC